MSMHDRLLQEKAKEHDLKEKGSTGSRGFKNGTRAVVTPTRCD